MVRKLDRLRIVLISSRACGQSIEPVTLVGIRCMVDAFSQVNSLIRRAVESCIDERALLLGNQIGGAFTKCIEASLECRGLIRSVLFEERQKSLYRKVSAG